MISIHDFSLVLRANVDESSECLPTISSGHDSLIAYVTCASDLWSWYELMSPNDSVNLMN